MLLVQIVSICRCTHLAWGGKQILAIYTIVLLPEQRKEPHNSNYCNFKCNTQQMGGNYIYACRRIPPPPTHAPYSYVCGKEETEEYYFPHGWCDELFITSAYEIIIQIASSETSSNKHKINDSDNARPAIYSTCVFHGLGLL